MPRLLERIPDRTTVRAFTFMVMDLDGANGQRYPEERPPEGLETYRLRFWPANL